LALLIRFGGAATLAALIALAVSEASLGSPLFFVLAAIPCIVYVLLAVRLLRDGAVHARTIQRQSLEPLLVTALLLAVAFRAPLMVRGVSPSNDMVRYVWDGRIQWMGYNPYTVIPSDPALAHTHTDQTRLMPSIHDRTPYPAAAQLFFRGMVAVWDSARGMKFALLFCDLLTILVLVKWLRETGRSPWLTLLYAWNPLVILEIAHSGHLDALGALWIAISAWMLSTRRGMRAAVALAVAVGVKLVPIVLVPLYWKRIRVRDAAVGAGVFLAFYLPFASAGALPLGAVPNVVQYVRFNGPLFKFLAAAVTPQGAALVAVILGLSVALWMRVKYPVDEPAAWAWPMAAALVAAPVVYPWYLLYFTPFLFTRRTIPLIAWTIIVLPVYVVWELAYNHGHRWRVPMPVVYVEYGTVLAVMLIMAVLPAREANRLAEEEAVAPSS